MNLSTVRSAQPIRGIAALAALLAFGCHAGPDDVGGQAGELNDPVRRQNAIGNLQRLYADALADNDGNREDPEVKAVADAMVEKLTQAYIDASTDNQNRLAMLELMKEMRDPRTIPALKEALDWRRGVSEEQAILAAQTLQFMDIPEGEKPGVVTALADAYRKATTAGNVELRVRVQTIRALGAIGHPSALEVLVEAATKQDEAQDFRINILAAQQLGKLGNAEAVPALIKGLFLFAPSNPAMRMNDVSSAALVRIGQPSLQPLLEVMNGRNEEANAIVESYIDAVRARDAQAAEQMTVAQATGGEATFALGSLGFREAFDPLMAETEAEDPFRKVNGAIALVRLNLEPSDLARVRETLQRVYNAMGDDLQGGQAKAQLVAAMRSLYDPGFIPFFMEQAGNVDAYPVVRLEAVTAVAMLANKEQAEALQSFISSNEDDPYHDNFAQGTAKALATAVACDESIECYIGKLSDSDPEVARKAAFMLGRLGRGNQQVIAALTEELDNTDVAIRLSAVAALDRVAVEGAPAAVAKIGELQESEEGRAIWTQFSREALPIQARLRARGSE